MILKLQLASFTQAKILTINYNNYWGCATAKGCHLEALNVQKPMEPELLVAMGIQTALNFLIIRTEQLSTIHRTW